MRKNLAVWFGIFLLLLCSVTGCTKSLEEQIAEQLELGQKYLTELNYEEAIVAFTKVIELDEKNVDAYMGRGQVYEAMAQAAGEESTDGKAYYEQAAEDYEQVLALSAADSLIYESLINIYQITDNTNGIENLTETDQNGIVDEILMKTTEKEMEAYRDLLDMYYYKIDAGWEETEDVSYLFHFAYSDVNGLSDAGYALIDLDENGVSELIVTSMDAAKSGLIYDLYTYINEQPVHLASSGERYGYYLCEDYTIYFEGSGGAWNSSFEKYTVDADKGGLSFSEGAVIDGFWNEENPWYYGGAECYDEENGYKMELMTNITEEEGSSIINRYQNQVISIELTPFEMYSPLKEMPKKDKIKKALRSYIVSEPLVQFVCDDFDSDGDVEGFGITGKAGAYDVENAKIYFVDDLGSVSLINEIGYLYGYGGGYFIENSDLINTGTNKFLALGGAEGQETWVYGVKEGQVYQPEVSGQHASFYQTEDGLYCGESFEGGPEGYQYYYKYEPSTGEFVFYN